jgi:RNA polymerase sigma-70 factor, ECF subfamily
MPDELTSQFLAGAGVAAGPPDLEQQLVQRLSLARARWPGVTVEAADVLRFWGECAARVDSSGPVIDALRTDELLLTFACARGHTRAIAAFEADYLSQVPRFVARQRLSAAALDDLMQQLRERLFVGQGGAAPKISQYGGRGPLGGWLRVVAVRAALNLLRGMRDDETAVERAPDVAGGDPERRYLQQRYGADLKRAIEEALMALPSKERQIIRLHILEGLPPETLATMFKVHRTTVVRWIAQLSEDLLIDARGRLGRELGLSDAELDSIIGVARSQLDMTLSLSQILGGSE